MPAAVTSLMGSWCSGFRTLGKQFGHYEVWFLKTEDRRDEQTLIISDFIISLWSRRSESADMKQRERRVSDTRIKSWRVLTRSFRRGRRDTGRNLSRWIKALSMRTTSTVRSNASWRHSKHTPTLTNRDNRKESRSMKKKAARFLRRSSLNVSRLNLITSSVFSGQI